MTISAILVMVTTNLNRSEFEWNVITGFELLRSNLIIFASVLHHRVREFSTTFTVTPLIYDEANRLEAKFYDARRGYLEPLFSRKYSMSNVTKYCTTVNRLTIVETDMEVEAEGAITTW